MLSDDVDTYLCIKSAPPDPVTVGDHKKDNKVFDKNNKNTQEKYFSQIPFTALCNLSEYKSCTVRTVTLYDDKSSFALKLVPTRAIGNKFLLLASFDENEITTWLAMCKSNMGKKSRGTKQGRDNCSTLDFLSKAGSVSSLRPGPYPIDSEFDDGLMDNEVYEAYSSGEFNFIRYFRKA